VLLDLHRRGVILAIASKNNPADALEVLERHPAMLLRPQHFAALRLNWTAKSENLRAIAAELNIGTDSLVFVDDNPVERDEVSRHLPEVLVVNLPKDPMQYAATLRQVASLERLRVLDEDRDRGRQYAEQRARTELERSAGSLEEFYRSLAMQVILAKVSRTTLPRVSQLTQKTNQFNLTTRRYDEARVAAMMDSTDWHIYTCSVTDRFGDNGLVGVAIAQDQGPVWEIDSLLMSCRVIGRTVETAMLSYLMATSRAAGARTLRGWYLPTRKNGPAATFYESHGFRSIDTRDGAGLWEFDLQAGNVEWPAWLEATAGEAHGS
jgi:FkbH-like protein